MAARCDEMRDQGQSLRADTGETLDGDFYLGVMKGREALYDGLGVPTEFDTECLDRGDRPCTQASPRSRHAHRRTCLDLV